jgi:hypothetical protein
VAETVFFSWQSDRPAEHGRSFVEAALERALRSLNSDAEIEEALRDELVVDTDTKDVPGQPPVVETIFKKIDACAVFVPDLTFVGVRAGGQPTPNPNVLTEYGWALKALGHSCIVPVMNIAYGAPVGDAMPFDMRHLRNPILYDLPEDSTREKLRLERDRIAKELEAQLKAVLKNRALAFTRDERPALYAPIEQADRPSRFRHSGASIGIADFHRNGPREVIIPTGPSFWLRLMPIVDPGRIWTVPELKKAMTENGQSLPQLFIHGSFSELRAEDGVGSFVQDGQAYRAQSVTFAFERGEVWAIDTRILSRIKEYSSPGNRSGLPVSDMRKDFNRVLASLLSFLDRLGVQPPYRWVAGADGVKMLGLYYPAPPNHRWMLNEPNGSCVADIVSEEGIIDGREVASQALKPFFVKLFAKCGIDWPDYLDETP